jgi:mitochondrial intermembrane space import and assembly protein 40
MVERCHEATANLKKCMDAHADYYAPVLMAEEAVNERAEAEAAAAAAAAAAETAKAKGWEPATEGEIKEEAVPQPAAGEEKKEETIAQKEKKEEAVSEKV